MGASKRAKKIRDSAEFDLTRLKALLDRPRDGSGIVYSWSLADILNARNAQMLGRFQLAAHMAESMRTDDAIFVASSNRLAPQRCVPVEMVAASDKPKALSIAAEADALFGQNGVGIRTGALASINLCLVDHGIAFGCNVAIPREDGSRIDYEHRYWPIEYVRWDSFRRVYVTRVDPTTVQPGDLLLQDPRLGAVGSYEVEIVHGDGRWVIYTNHEIDPFKKEAAILAGCIVWARHAFAIRDWSKGSVAHGNAKFVGEMPQGVVLQKDGKLTAEAAAMVQLLLDLANGDSPAGIRPFGSKTDFLTNTSTAWQVWTELVGNGERASARIYLGTDGILGAQGGAPGVDISQLFGVALTKVRGDLGCIQRAFQTGVIEPWCAMNFGDSSLAPTRRYMLPDADMEAWRQANATRRTAFFADIKAQRENGFRVAQEDVDATAQEYDVRAPQLPEELGPKPPTIQLAPTDLANVITVNEARASSGVGLLMLPDGKTEDPDGTLTVGQFAAKLLAPPPAPAAASSSEPAPAPADVAKAARDAIDMGFRQVHAELPAFVEKAARSAVDVSMVEHREQLSRVERSTLASFDARGDALARAIDKVAREAIEALPAVIEKAVRDAVDAKLRAEPTKVRSFAERSAAFQADLKDYRENGLCMNQGELEQLAKLHDVPAPRLASEGT